MFGAPASSASEMLSKALGKPKSIESLEECGAGPLTTSDFGILSLIAQDEKFVGWSVNSPAAPGSITTETGVKIGSTCKELERAYTVEVFESSLGNEFVAGQLGGLLDGPRPTATITNLWGGTNCIMR